MHSNRLLSASKRLSKIAQPRAIRWLLLAWLYAPLSSSLLAQTIRYVRADASIFQNPATAISWNSATPDLQGAIDASLAGDEVWVAAGTYKPTSNTANRSASFSMKNGVKIYGGYVLIRGGGSYGRGPLNPSGSILSGDIDNNGTLDNNSYHVVRNAAGLTNSALLDGFVITGGNAAGSGVDATGAGMLNNGSGAGNACSPTIRNCQFTNNRSAAKGGAMYNNGSTSGNASPQISNTVFLSNTATNSGGVNASGGAIANDASTSGTSSPSCINCSFVTNQASFNGGAIDNTGENNGTNLPTFLNCSFQGNTAGSSGGAIVNFGLFGRSTLTLTNCIFWNNEGSNTIGNGNLGTGNTASTTATYSLFDAGALVGVTTSSPTNLTTAVSPFTSTTDTQLNACSPAINAGDPATTTATVGNTDLAGNPRFYTNGRIDMGAYEFQGGATTAHPDYAALVDLYNATNGPGWTNKTGWLTNCDPCSGWYGVACTNGRVSDLSLSSNQLSGTIPTSLSALTNLQSLGLGGNQLTGSIPSGLSALTNLQYLALPGNQLTGSIPSSLSALPNLQYLALPGNQLSGPIPSGLSVLRNLQYLSLSSNQLSGPIPSGLSVLRNLQYLSLSSNQLTGSIPSGLSALPNLQYLYLSGNQLSGPIPSGLSALPNLQYLDLSSNQLSGCFPASFTAFCGITTNFFNNPGLPGGGNFTAFCTSGTGSDALRVSLSASSSVVCPGTTVTLIASVTGSVGSYQWYRNGAVLSGQTSAILSLPGVGSANAGTYTLLVTGSCGTTVTSSSFSLSLPLSSPTRLYVNAFATGANTGLSWADAFPDLQSALNYGCSGNLTEIWVAGGVYKPTSTTDRSASFKMLPNVAIYGGFLGTETSLSQRNWATHPTILSGDIGVSANITDNSYHVIANRALTATAILDGFTIMAGNASGASSFNNGGGMYNYSIGSRTLPGDAICSPQIRNCQFIYNTASNGGAIYNEAQTGQGDGTTNPQFINCLFQNNIATSGGAIYTTTGLGSISNPQLLNCSFQNNTAGSGGALFNFRGSVAGSVNVQLTNCVFWGNGAGNTFVNSFGQGIVTGSYSLFEASVTGYSSGVGNLTTTTSPFISPGNAQLAEGSLAINAGDPATTAATVGTLDLAGNARFYNNGRIDMGAFEFQAGTTGAIVTVKDGQWTDPSVWSVNRVPAAGDDVTVQHTVVIPVNSTATIRRLTYGFGGKIQYGGTPAQLRIGF